MRLHVRDKKIPNSSDQIVQIVLQNRCIEDKKEFFSPTHPMNLQLDGIGIDESQMKKALKRLAVAREKKEKIIIYGDYDCDGICATAILWQVMHTLGFAVLPFVPDREKHGYGLSQKGVDEILAGDPPALLISVDNGIVAHTQWKRLADAGVYTILTDHHEPDGKDLAVDCTIHTTKLCGATIAWMVARELCTTCTPKTASAEINSYLDLAAIATIADQVPLLGANRSFAYHGCTQLRKTTRPGLLALCRNAAIELEKIDTFSINYVIAPRINAMGRIGSPLDALRMLCTRDEKRAMALVDTLHSANTTRQDMTQEMFAIALEKKDEWSDESVIIVADTRFHEGIIGLIASKLTEMYHKPSVVIAVGTQHAKGSARSIAGVHITNLLRDVRETLLEVGGHPMAAGIKVDVTMIDEFCDMLRKRAKKEIDQKLLEHVLQVDCVLPFVYADLSTAKKLLALAPFGNGNEEPQFVLEKAQVTDCKRIGKEERHLKLVVKDPDTGRTLSCIAFGKGEQAEKISVGSVISLVGSLGVNVWREKESVQFLVKNIL